MKEDPRTMNILNTELRGMPQKDYEQELNIRSYKAGYTTREGKQIPPKIMARGFGVSKLPKVWPRNKDGTLIGDN